MRSTVLRRVLLACGAMLGVTSAVPAAAQPVSVYSSRAAFLVALTGQTTVTFTGDAPDGGFTMYGTSLTRSGVTFQAGPGNTLNVTSNTYSPGFEYGTGAVLTPVGTAPRILNILLPLGTTAFGIDFGAFSSVPTTFTLSTGDVFVRNGGTPIGTNGTGFAFVGFTSAVALTSVQVRVAAAGGGNAVDNVTVGQAAVVPEPSTYVLVAAGLLSASALARWRRGATTG